MKCIICNSNSNYYFSKEYLEAPFDQYMKDIGTVDYYKCSHCGFVLSKTHCELDEKTWHKLNSQFHHYQENSEVTNKVNQPPYAEQAMMIAFLAKNDIISSENMVDYAAGYGTLSNLLEKYNNIDLPIFDPYIQVENSSKYIDEVGLSTYKTVINSAMFEHILNREDLERVNSLVDKKGCLIIHTVVGEHVPKDPDWFYFRPPVHTAFHTNKSMNILMEQWGFHSSIYSPQSKCWVLIRDNIDNLELKIEQLNDELKTKWFYYKKGFVDYWK